MKSALRFQNVIKKYGRQAALAGLDLEVPVGVILGLVGANGAGKTTTLGIGAGLIRPNGGQVDLLGDGPFDATRHGGRVALLPQDTELPGDSSPGELLRAYGRLQGLTRREAARHTAELLERLHLSDRAHARIRTLSHGMRKRLLIAQCFLGAPELILLDEPLSGLDPREIAAMRQFLTAQRDHRTLVISSHNLDEIERLCCRVAFIEQGRCIRHETTESLTNRIAHLVYHTLPGDFPLEALSNALTGVTLSGDPAAGRLVCQFDSAKLSMAEINQVILPLLLRAGIGIREIRRGETLESVYLNHA